MTIKPGAAFIAHHYCNAVGRPKREGGTSSGRPHTCSGEEHASFVVELASAGASSCLEYLLSEMLKHAKSTDTKQHQRTELSKGPSGLSQRSFGQGTQRHSSPQSCGETCEQPAAGSQVRSTRPPMSGPSCSPLRLIQTDLCGNSD